MEETKRRKNKQKRDNKGTKEQNKRLLLALLARFFLLFLPFSLFSLRVRYVCFFVFFVSLPCEVVGLYYKAKEFLHQIHKLTPIIMQMNIFLKLEFYNVEEEFQLDLHESETKEDKIRRNFETQGKKRKDRKEK